MVEQNDGAAYERVVELAMKLHPLLVMTYGESGVHFRAMHPDLQDAYLWECADLASEIHELMPKLV